MQLGSLWVRSRNFMAEFFDIVIVGGGPAGSTAGTLLAKHDRWIWIIPITAKKTSIGVVLDAQTFKRMKMEPEDAYTRILQENPKVAEQMSRARRVTEVHATGDFFFPEQTLYG